jgi:agmatine deiminase
MPAEWEPHEATWLSWPHNADTWPDCLDAIQSPMVEMVAALAEVECVHLNILDGAQRRYVEQLLAPRVPADRIQLHSIPTNDAWCRDHGAIFCVGPAGAEHRVVAAKFGYNAWGGKYPPFDLDAQVAERMAAALAVPCFEQPMVLEGGAIDVNGRGVLLTTEQCLLNPNRNPSMNRAATEECLEQPLGVDTIVWLGNGIDGDDTDGHVDELTRFVAERRVVTAIEPNRDDPNHEPLQENRRRLEAFRFADGGALEVVDLPMPAPLHFRGQRLPASYANFYIANDLVLVPEFGVAADTVAADVLADCFPDRHIVAIDCRHLVVGLGGLHCLTQQVPAGLSRQSRFP